MSGAAPPVAPLGGPAALNGDHREQQRQGDRGKSRMHQSSHRILRWVDDGNRPHSKDLHDLFCILVVAVPLKMHRVRLQKRPGSFTTQDAMHKLANLKFVHTNKRYSPDDPSVILLTTLVTTYAMVPDMARLLCQNFLAARLLESCEGKTDFLSADSVWQPTPKGLNLLQAFASRNGVTERHVHDALESPRNVMRLLCLERNRATDLVIADRGTVEVVFRRLIGAETAARDKNGSDSDSLPDLPNGVSGVKISREKRVAGKVYQNVVTGRACVDWLMSCGTFITEKEAMGVAAQFLHHGLCEFIPDDRVTLGKFGFSSSKNAHFRISRHGLETAGWIARAYDAPGAGSESPKSAGAARDSNRSRMLLILGAPALRLLFREFLRDIHCEENFVFHAEVDDFLYHWSNTSAAHGSAVPLELLRETLAGSYDLYNAFLAPGSPCELNIDHGLRHALIKRMTRPDLPEADLRAAVDETVALCTEAKNSIFKLMASDSVPKFVRDTRYAEYLEQQGFLETTAPGYHRGPNGAAAEMSALALGAAAHGD